MTRWLVGVDLQTSSAGAVRYAAWLHEHSDESVSLHALHAIEQIDEHYAITLGVHSRGRLLELTREATHEALNEAGYGACFEQIDAVAGEAADEVLDEQRRVRDATGLIVGRQGPLREGFPPRLGRVARRLLRHAEGPVIVVAPDLSISRLEGPVVLATDLGPSSAAATRFAIERARQWQRPLRIVHVLRDSTKGLSFLKGDILDGARKTRFQAQREAAEKWASALDLDGIDVHLDLPSGSAIDALLDIARLGSPLVVCGARRLSWVGRHLEASHATTLSSHSPVPVAVVPPVQTDQPG